MDILLNKTAESNGDSGPNMDRDFSSLTNLGNRRGPGLSNRTAKKLEELRQRNAADSTPESYAEYKASRREVASINTNGNSSPDFSDLKARRDAREKEKSPLTGGGTVGKSVISSVTISPSSFSSNSISITSYTNGVSEHSKSNPTTTTTILSHSKEINGLAIDKEPISPSKKESISSTARESHHVNLIRKDSSLGSNSELPSRGITSLSKDTNSYTHISSYAFPPKDNVDSHKNSSNQIKDIQSLDHFKNGFNSLISNPNNISSPGSDRKYKDDDEYVGFATLPEQVHRKAIKRGFDFVLMVVGESGLGKSTLINSLFNNCARKDGKGESGLGKSTAVNSLLLNDMYKDRKLIPVEERVHRTVEIESKHMEIEEKGVKLRLTIVDTPGFNDAVNAEDCWKPVESYIDEQFEQYLKDESGLNRKNIKDNRVHCCLYFIPPYGHGLRQLDIKFMRRLHEKVNIVPIIAKSDTLVPVEVKKLKKRILDQIEENDIKIYEFPECDSDEDEEFLTQDNELKAAIPFAVIGSSTMVEVGGKKVRGRLYPWGIVEVENPAHCDFIKLRQMLISTHMQDLKDVTRDIHYENYRARHIKDQLMKSSKDRNKLKRDSSPNFEAMMDADKLLEEKDEQIRKMQEEIAKMQQLMNGSKAGKPVSNGLGNL